MYHPKCMEINTQMYNKVCIVLCMKVLDLINRDAKCNLYIFFNIGFFSDGTTKQIIETAMLFRNGKYHIKCVFRSIYRYVGPRDREVYINSH